MHAWYLQLQIKTQKKYKKNKSYGFIEWDDKKLGLFWQDLMKTKPTKLQLKMIANVF